MSDSLVVLLHDAIAGILTRQNGRLRFDYTEEHRAKRGAVPLSLSMPTQIRSHLDQVVTPWLWGLLPDNEQVLSRWAREFHVSASSPFSMLATPIGGDCAGAVRFVGTAAVEDQIERVGHVEWLAEEDVAQRLRELREDSTAWLGRTFTGQFSLAGAQAKTALLYQDGRWGVPSGATPTSHILKPAIAGLDDHDLNEHLCLDAASRAGLLVARTRVEQFGDESAVVVDRYDRREFDGRLIRIHQEDLCQALGFPPSAKYQNDGGPGAAEIVELLRLAMPGTVAEESVRRFIDALAWNWLIAGTDAHAKNYSILLGSSQVRLAPLYDIASALPYPVHEKKLRFAMKIGGDYDVFTFRDPWPKAAAELGVSPELLHNRVRELAGRVVDAFAEAAAAPGVVALQRELPTRLIELVAERAARCITLLDSTDGHVWRSTRRTPATST